MIANLLLRVSIVLLIIGLTLGIVMGIRQDFTLAPAHAHLNLVGFVLMFAAGLYYRLVPAAAEGLVAKIQAGLHIVGAIVFPIGIAMVVSWGPAYEAAAIVGSLIVYAAVGLFAYIVYRTTAAPRAVSDPALAR
ncbi:MAG: hypothetical protein IRZ09_09490 [Variibacter sp.]|mgnify:CR=1 FL=1|nr:hypothetical protein [Variibacter sp.]